MKMLTEPRVTLASSISSNLRLTSGHEMWCDKSLHKITQSSGLTFLLERQVEAFQQHSIMLWLILHEARNAFLCYMVFPYIFDPLLTAISNQHIVISICHQSPLWLCVGVCVCVGHMKQKLHNKLFDKFT